MRLPAELRQEIYRYVLDATFDGKGQPRLEKQYELLDALVFHSRQATSVSHWRLTGKRAAKDSATHPLALTNGAIYCEMMILAYERTNFIFTASTFPSRLLDPSHNDIRAHLQYLTLPLVASRNAEVVPAHASWLHLLQDKEFGSRMSIQHQVEE